jgi:hypothetical protein
MMPAAAAAELSRWVVVWVKAGLWHHPLFSSAAAAPAETLHRPFCIFVTALPLPVMVLLQEHDGAGCQEAVP